MNNNLFRLENFKKWMTEQKPLATTQSKLIGLKVESKIKNVKRIAKNIQSNDGDIIEMADDFIKDGGQIVEVENKDFLIEVDSGIFQIHRCFVRKKD